MNKAICVKDFEGVGFLEDDKDKKVHIKKGDIIEWDNQGYYSGSVVKTKI